MSLLDIRKEFVKVSGRYDLVVDAFNDDWTDNGANFYINAGQLYLDQRIEVKQSEAVFYKKLQADIVGCSIPDCRAIREVWIQNLESVVSVDWTDPQFVDTSGKSRLPLKKVSKEWMRDKYRGMFNNITSGPPKYYCLTTLRVYPDNFTINQLESYAGFMDALAFNSMQNPIYNAILMLPPLDHEYVAEVVGLFYSPQFTEDTQETIWSYRYPTVLVWAALRELEITYRNTEGAKDWETAISARLLDIDKDTVEEVIAGVSQMEG
jgi:hypothetical protein